MTSIYPKLATENIKSRLKPKIYLHKVNEIMHCEMRSPILNLCIYLQRSDIRTKTYCCSRTIVVPDR